MQVRNLLKEQYPDLVCIGTGYPIGLKQVLISRIVTILQLTLIAITLFGEKLFAKAEEAPEMLRSLANNKFGVCMITWFLGNIVSQNLTNTGAFEIAYDGQMVFSKLDMQRMPTIQEIMGGVEAGMKARVQ